jgi:hypothetical protein
VAAREDRVDGSGVGASCGIKSFTLQIEPKHYDPCLRHAHSLPQTLSGSRNQGEYTVLREPGRSPAHGGFRVVGTGGVALQYGLEEIHLPQYQSIPGVGSLVIRKSSFPPIANAPKKRNDAGGEPRDAPIQPISILTLAF